MPNTQHSTLFQNSGPDATLDYLWSRLGSRDLSQDEALALISAVHRELSRSQAEDPSVYASYSRFMESLNRQMPVVHDFVVSRWSESRYTTRRSQPESDADVVDAEAEVDRQSEPDDVVKAQPNQAARQDTTAEVGEGEESGEPGEPEEDEPEERAGVAEGAKEGNAEGGAEEDEPEEEPESEARGAKNEEGEPEKIEDSAEGTEAQEEGEEAEQAEREPDEQPQTEGEEAEGDESPEAETEGEAGEADQPESESEEGEPGEKGGEEESEWPEEFEPESPEPLEGEEAEGEAGEEAAGGE